MHSKIVVSIVLVLSWKLVEAMNLNSSTTEVKVKLGDLVKLTCPVLEKAEAELKKAEENRTSYSGNAPIAKRMLDLKGFDSILWVVDKGNILVGAALVYDRRKFGYHASTGQLIIQEMEATDVGYYHCLVSSGQGDPESTAPQTDLGSVLVKLTDGKEATTGWYSENETNIVRAAIAAGVAGCVISALCIVCKYGWHRPSKRKSQLVITNIQQDAIAAKKHDCSCDAKQKSKSTNTINSATEDGSNIVAVCAIDFDDDDYDDEDDRDAGACRREFKYNQHKLKKAATGTPACHLHEKTVNCATPKSTTHLGNSVTPKKESHKDKSSYPLSVTRSSHSSPNPSICSKL